MQKRNTSTKAALKKVFIQLMKSKGFDNLTVSDLARGAEINRGTFYLHYLDKYDLMEQLEMEIIYDLKQILLSDNETATVNEGQPIDLIPYCRVVKALNYIQSDFEFIAALSGKGGDPNFPTLVKEVMEAMVRGKIPTMDQLSFSKKGIPEDYAMEILLSGIVAIIMVWIRKGGVESPEEVAQMIELAKQSAPNELLV